MIIFLNIKHTLLNLKQYMCHKNICVNCGNESYQCVCRSCAVLKINALQSVICDFNKKIS